MKPNSAGHRTDSERSESYGNGKRIVVREESRAVGWARPSQRSQEVPISGRGPQSAVADTRVARSVQAPRTAHDGAGHSYNLRLYSEAPDRRRGGHRELLHASKPMVYTRPRVVLKNIITKVRQGLDD